MAERKQNRRLTLAIGRPPLGLETWGRIYRATHRGKPAALVYVRDSDGKRRRVLRTGRTAAEAERLLTATLRVRLKVAEEIITPESTLGFVAPLWIEEVKRDDRAAATIKRYRSTIRSHVEPVRDMRVRECTTPRLQRLVNDVADSSGPGAARMLIVVLKGMFGLAGRHGAIRENPVAFVKGPARKHNVVVAPGLEEIHRLGELLAQHDRRLIRGGTALRDLGDIGDLLIGTGARINEILAITWPHVDFDERRVAIVATVTQVEGGGLEIQPFPKTEKSRRRLKLPGFAWEVLERRRQSAYCELVFPSSTGTPRWAENVRLQWANALRGTELEGMTPKACRKAVATYLDSCEDSEAAAEQLGHGTKKVTERYYIPEKLDRADYSDRLARLGSPRKSRTY